MKEIIHYVTGTDACRVVLNYLGFSKKNNVHYELPSIYMPGKCILYHVIRDIFNTALYVLDYE